MLSANRSKNEVLSISDGAIRCGHQLSSVGISFNRWVGMVSVYRVYAQRCRHCEKAHCKLKINYIIQEDECRLQCNKKGQPVPPELTPTNHTQTRHLSTTSSAFTSQPLDLLSVQYNFERKNQHSSGEVLECTMQTDESQAYIFRPYITVKGKRITRPNGGMFKIPVSREQKK